MKNRILSVYPNSELGQSTSSSLYVVDFTERTGNARGVEIHNAVPKVPDGNIDMDCMKMSNPHRLSIDYNIFDDHQFKDDAGNDLSHGECCLYPTENDDKTWIAFVEIKDCKVKNIINYKDKVKEQIISTVQSFRDGNIIDRQNVYGIVSFPRRNKTAFNQTIFDDYTEYKSFYHEHKIHFYATNEVVVEDSYKLSNK